MITRKVSVSLQHFHKDLQSQFFLNKSNSSAREANYFLVSILKLVYFYYFEEHCVLYIIKITIIQVGK